MITLRNRSDVSRRTLVWPSRSWSRVCEGLLLRIPPNIALHWAAVPARVPCRGDPRKTTPDVARTNFWYSLPLMPAISRA